MHEIIPLKSRVYFFKHFRSYISFEKMEATFLYLVLLSRFNLLESP